jgi:hypothetical protein
LYDGNGTSGHPTATSAVNSELATRLDALGRTISPVEISELWVFPPLPDLVESGEFVLFTRVLANEMRRVCAVEFTEPEPAANGRQANGGSRNGNGVAGNGTTDTNGQGATQGTASSGNGNGNGNGAPRPADSNGNDVAVAQGPTVRIIEYGRVPSNRVQRVVDGFRRRLGDEREPIHLRVNGCTDSWVRILASDSSDG